MAINAHSSTPDRLRARPCHPKAAHEAGPNLEAAIKANAKIQAPLLRQSSTVISGLVKGNKLTVVATYYDIGTGAVSLLG
jgi:carbonic anhydrase